MIVPVFLVFLLSCVAVWLVLLRRWFPPHEPFLTNLADFEIQLRKDLQANRPPRIPIDGNVFERSDRAWTPAERAAMTANFRAQCAIFDRVWNEIHPEDR